MDLPEMKEGGDAVRGPVDYSKASKTPQVLSALAAAMGAFVLGTMLGWSSPVGPSLQKNNSTNDSGSLQLDEAEMAWAASLVNLGALFGGLSGGAFVDLFGRKKTLIGISAPFIGGWVLIITAINPAMMYSGRIIGGLAGGVCSVASPAYIGEISMPSIRGTLGSFFQLLIVSGIVMTSCLGLGLEWQWLSIVCSLFVVVFLTAVIFVPESPYFLMKKGHHSEAKKALQRLRGPAYDVDRELWHLDNSVRLQSTESSNFTEVFKWWALKPLLVAVGLMFFQQMSGINAALFFTTNIFSAAGSSIPAMTSNVIVNGVMLAVTVVSLILVDRLGRKVLLLVSEVFMVVAMVVLGTFFYLKDNGYSAADSLGWLPLVSLIVFISAFAIGLGPMPWLMTGEVVPTRVKGPATSIATFVNWFLAFIVTRTFTDIQYELTRAGSFWMFAGMCVLGIFFCTFAVPETKGKTSDEIQAFFGNSPPDEAKQA